MFLALNVTFFRQLFLCKEVSFVHLLSDFTIETKVVLYQYSRSYSFIKSYKVFGGGGEVTV